MLASGLVLCTAAQTANAVEANPKPGKTIRLLAIGNSFAQNAAEYLPQLVASQGNTLDIQQASIGGCSLEKHWNLAQKFESDPENRDSKPYYLYFSKGKYKKSSLKQMLQTQSWDVVTIQQHSWTSIDLKTYRPYAQLLSDYVRTNCPTAKVWVHETWAYRPDNRLLLKQGMTPTQMYEKLHAAYATIAKEIAADGILPVGTAFHRASLDPRWSFETEANVAPEKFKYPDLPSESHALSTGWHWNTREKPPKLVFDGKHATTAGKYLAALVWYEKLFGKIQGNAFVPKGLSTEDAAFLQEIAHKVAESSPLSNP
jgi:hypothetical protein